MMDNLNTLKKLVSTLRIISISIGLDCRDPPGLANSYVRFVNFSKIYFSNLINELAFKEDFRVVPKAHSHINITLKMIARSKDTYN